MVLVGLLRPVVTQIIKQASRYYRVEGKAFNALYKGFPQSKTIGRGVRHGLTAGSIAGSLLNGGGDDITSGIPKKNSRKRDSSRPSYKTRSRPANRRRFRCPEFQRGGYNR